MFILELQYWLYGKALTKINITKTRLLGIEKTE